MKHTNKIAIDILSQMYMGYFDAPYVFDNEYMIIVDALKKDKNDKKFSKEVQDFIDDLISIIDAQRERIRKISQWISIKERSPEKDGHYLVHCPQSFPKNYRGVIAEYDSNAKAFYSESGDHHVKDVTHWTYIPNEPETNN